MRSNLQQSKKLRSEKYSCPSSKLTSDLFTEGCCKIVSQVRRNKRGCLQQAPNIQRLDEKHVMIGGKEDPRTKGEIEEALEGAVVQVAPLLLLLLLISRAPCQVVRHLVILESDHLTLVVQSGTSPDAQFCEQQNKKLNLPSWSLLVAAGSASILVTVRLNVHYLPPLPG